MNLNGCNLEIMKVILVNHFSLLLVLSWKNLFQEIVTTGRNEGLSKLLKLADWLPISLIMFINVYAHCYSEYLSVALKSVWLLLLEQAHNELTYNNRFPSPFEEVAVLMNPTRSYIVQHLSTRYFIYCCGFCVDCKCP